MNTAFFENLGPCLPLSISFTRPTGASSRELHFHDGETPRRLTLTLSIGGQVTIVGEEGEWSVLIPCHDRDRPSCGKVAAFLAPFLTFPATDRMFWGIGEADVSAVQEALKGAADVHATNDHDLLPMDALAISLGCRADIVRLLMKNHSDSGSSWERDLGAKLHEISRLAHIRSILLEAGAIDQAPFRVAVRSGDFAMARSELAAGASLDAITLGQVPLLIERILHSDLDGVSWLLDQGAKTDWQQPPGEPFLPAHFANALPFLRKSAQGKAGLNALSAARLAEFPEAEALLIQHGKTPPCS